MSKIDILLKLMMSKHLSNLDRKYLIIPQLNVEIDRQIKKKKDGQVK